MDWQPIVNFLEAQGPLVLFAIYNYMNAKTVRAEQESKNLLLQKAIDVNHQKVQSLFAGQSDTSVIDEITSGTASVQSVLTGTDK